jgi:hypothetical protein
LGNSPKVLQIRVDISLRSPARGEKIGCAANHNKHYTPDGKGCIKIGIKLALNYPDYHHNFAFTPK